MDFITDLRGTFREHASWEAAIPMENYMKNHFPFYGIKTEKRRALFKQVWQEHEQEVKTNCRVLAMKLFAYQERELHYCAVEILIKNLKKHYQKSDIQLIEKLILTHSWWDTVDTIAKYVLGQYLLEFPEEIPAVIERFSASESLWLNRSALLFQLSFKSHTNEKLLFSLCTKHSSSREFFIQKAIGWALREYGKHCPDGVKAFVLSSALKPLSVKEALKNIG